MNKSGYVSNTLITSIGDSTNYRTTPIEWTATEDCFIGGNVYLKTAGKGFILNVAGANMGYGWIGASGIVSFPISGVPVKKGQLVRLSGDEFCGGLKVYKSS